MIKVAIIGCGKMADQHAVQIKRIPGADIVGVCDSEVLMAQQLAERFGIRQYFTSLHEMLQTIRPDVIHVTTPPHSHFELGKICLLAGCNVYMEKPFTLNTDEAKTLIELAKKNGLKIIAGHNAQFTHAMIRMRELVNQNYLGGKPVHMECQYCYEFGDENYAKAFLGDSNHWVRKLPGSLLQNIISHGISKIAEFLAGENPKVLTHGFTSSFLNQIGEHDIIDEVRVIICDEKFTTANFTFSSQIKPAPHQFRLYGPKRSIIVDDDHQVLITLDNKEYKSFLKYFIPPVGFAKQYIGNFRRNVFKFLKNDFHLPNDAGLYTLIDLFYASVINNTPLPISHHEILLTSKIMDDIFKQLKQSEQHKIEFHAREHLLSVPYQNS
ncbi:Gfo/Idh/MocA family oxidoreductase [candidate division KSB1 bacterium]|nr:Gfo/Idh/MocA family oxidoreductase [candidate division KSB1 bacterium]